MISLILAAGKGERLGLHRNKCMLEYQGKSLLGHNLERASEVCEKIYVVVGHGKEDIMKGFGDQYNNIPIQYIVQAEQRGLIDAVEKSKEHITEDFFLLLGDEVLVESRHRLMLDKFRNENLFGVCGVKYSTPDKIRRTYTIETIGEKIVKLVEKPSTILSLWQGTGHCMFKNDILRYLDCKPRDIAEWIQLAVDDGKLVKAFEICSEFFNINTKQDLEELTEFNDRKASHELTTSAPYKLSGITSQ